tara:strand:- start:258 stop:461 length:204 start_codon:yes stop_codon:yes gene_type:complete
MVRESLQKSLRPLAVGAMCNSFIWLATMLSAQKVFAQFTPLGHEGNDGDITVPLLVEQILFRTGYVD